MIIYRGPAEIIIVCSVIAGFALGFLVEWLFGMDTDTDALVLIAGCSAGIFAIVGDFIYRKNNMLGLFSLRASTVFFIFPTWVVGVLFLALLVIGSNAEAATSNPCRGLISASQIEDIVGRPFNEGEVGPPLPGANGIICSWSAETPIRKKHDASDPRKNRTEVVATLIVHGSTREAREAYNYFFSERYVDRSSGREITPQKVDGIGDAAFVATSTHVLHDRTVFMVRYVPYLGAPRNADFRNVEFPVARLISRRLGRF